MHGWTAIDVVIQRQARDILLRMKMLSEGPARGIILYASRASDPDRSPHGNGSLFEDWLPKFSRATDDQALTALCIRGETAIAQFRGQYRAEMELPTDEEAAMKKICETCVGLDPIEVSRKMASKVSPGWVETARRKHRRNSKDGQRLEGWAGLTDEERLRHIHHALAQGWSLRRTALEADAPLTSLHRAYGHFFAA